MMKSAGKMNLPTFSRTSSIIPFGSFSDQSANCSVTVVGLASPKSSFLKIVKGIRLMLAPKSHRAFLNIASPMEHGIVKLPESLSLGGNFFAKMHYILQ
jgi:hypothetical protein